MLGEFEYVLITTAAGLGENAYGVAIREEIEAVLKRKCSIGALYTTMDRLEGKGLLKTWTGEATPQRGGRGKRMGRVTPLGGLEARDREIVLGDLIETGESAWRCMLEVFGLVLRRQAGLWRKPWPWLAGFLVALPSGFLLMVASFSVSCTWER